MSTFLRAIEFLSLSLWLGSDVFLSFVVAPGAFRILAPNRDHAGAIVGYSLNVMHLGGIVCGCVLLLARLTRTRTLASLARSEEHTSELQSQSNLVCRLLLEK